MKELQIKTDLSGLNERQKEAVITEEKRVLVLAGAGSGKTKTLLQKLIYLINDKNVNPSNILAITFTKNAANEMIDRLLISTDKSGEYEKIMMDKGLKSIQKDNKRYQFVKKFAWIDKLTIRTFHSLCYNILRNYGVHTFDNKFRILNDQKINEEQFSHLTAPEVDRDIMKKILIETCYDKEYLLDLKRYILDYIIDKIHLRDLENNIYYDGKFYTTLKGDKVKSKSERDIADWFYRHNIQYRYEQEVHFKKFKCKPDFYIPQADLYLEHVSNLSYPLKEKEKQFEEAGKLYVKIHEKMTQDSALFNMAMEKILKGRLSENYLAESAVNFEEEFKMYHDDVDDFIKLLLRVNNMIKVENLSYEDILKKGESDKHERISVFYKLAIPLLKKYTDYCCFKSYLDFNDLIIKAVELINSDKDTREEISNKYQYILVDEFQDVNSLQVELIHKILTPKTQLFCVGDDWQSIYGFRGSEVDYIINFEKYFKTPTIIKLNLNYRSTDHIVGASNEVIKHNKFKVDKDIKASKKSDKRINIYASNSEDDELEYFITETKRLLAEGYNYDDILVLYRRSKMFLPYSKRLKLEGLKIRGRTIHASKGLEASAVFIIGLTEGNGGFPDIWLDDRIFQTIRKVKRDMLKEEERRLFYVALTRAKDELFLITRKGNESSFLSEIPEQYSISFKQKLNPIIDKVLLCKNCNSQVQEHFVYCPFCSVSLKT
ncbi:MAG: ATP-dependent helicase [Bacteroidales bacterium]|nr:ATP-dependent helicase [Bacteroidales bacterium]